MVRSIILFILLALYSSTGTAFPIAQVGKKPNQKNTQTNKLFKSYLQLSTFKHKVLSENLANINTPGYKADDVEMPEKIEDLAVVSQSGKKIKMYITSDKHISHSREHDSNFKSHKLKDPDEIKKNGNNVSLRQQMTKLSQNKTDYTTAVKSYATINSLFSSVIGK